ncbi:LOW QUALITY PROTEIN: FERM and PDZ domain-containing protein 2 [Hipposideros larvatus]
MSLASVTLASALQVRGETLSEEEIWSLLSLSAEWLLKDLRERSSNYVVCPFSTSGSLSFQGHICHIEAVPFKAPELLQRQSFNEQPDPSQYYYNLGELAYFGLAYLKGKELFFLDNETRLCKVAPEGWNEQSQRPPRAFTLFLRIKLFVSHHGLLQQSTRHQFYLQLWKDIEKKMYYNDETLLQLGVLTLQAEFGSYPEEQVESKAYFRVENYIPASLIERMTALRVQVQEMHCLSPVILGEDAELEYLRVIQQLPEYGVLVHVLPEKTRPGGEMALGICAKGVIVYEVKNNSRIATLFQWREIGKLRMKEVHHQAGSGKKHIFVTDSVKTYKYLLGLCSTQHGFHAQMNAPALHLCVQMANLSLARLAQSKPLTWIQRSSCSENALSAHQEDAAGGLLCTSLDNFSRDTSRETGAWITGFVINEGEDVGKGDPGIFISSVIPGGSAEKAKKMEPGGQTLALNHISLESFTFNMAVLIQNSPDNMELIISQSEGVFGNIPSDGKNSTANSGVFSTDNLSIRHQGSFSSLTQDQERNIEELEMAGTQSLLPRWRLQLSTLSLKGAGSSCPPPSETNASGIYFVELVKEDGTLGFSVIGGINMSVLYGGIYVKSIIPGGTAAKEGQITWSDQLLQVDEVSLCGLTHKAVQCLKGSEQVARWVLEKGPRTAQQCPSVNHRMRDEYAAVSLATALPDRPASCVSATDGPKFEVKLKKNAGGLGFSFVQMARESCSHLNKILRIKQLFPGQPEENGAIAAGDIILAVNGRPTEGLIFQEVLHLLGPSQEVTLLLCRPLPGVLPEMDQGWYTPVLSADNFTRATCTDEQSPSLDQEDSWRDSAFPDTEDFQQVTREVQWDQDIERPWANSLMFPGESHPHLCRLHQEVDVTASATSLEKDVRQNCYSVCDIRRLERFSHSSSLTRLSTDIF